MIHCSGAEKPEDGTASDRAGESKEAGHTKRKNIQGRAVYNFSDYMSVDRQVLAMLETAKRISLTDYRVLIQGENGTGKGVLAQAIHNNSSRSGKQFLKLNLGALSEQQMLEELAAGKEDGIKALERAQGGTLYLNGIHHLPDSVQRKLLYILDGEPNVRFIFSTDCDLYQMCREGKFQTELFYQINEVSLSTIPVRKRGEDIPMLFEYFLRNIYNNPSLDWNELCSDGLRSMLLKYSWPGNGMEIENLCKYFSCVRNNRRLTVRDLPPYMLSQILEKQEKLGPLERQLLVLIEQNPKIGRSRLYQLLRDQGVEVTEGKIRSTLQSMAERNLLKTNRTKGGCEITEDGEILI